MVLCGAAARPRAEQSKPTSGAPTMLCSLAPVALKRTNCTRSNLGHSSTRSVISAVVRPCNVEQVTYHHVTLNGGSLQSVHTPVPDKCCRKMRSHSQVTRSLAMVQRNSQGLCRSSSVGDSETPRPSLWSACSCDRWFCTPLCPANHAHIDWYVL
jgi:hypothetical protein